jgi:hypothetical protein
METAVCDIRLQPAQRRDFVADVRGFALARFHHVRAQELRERLHQRFEAAEPTRLASASVAALLAGRRFLQPLLATQELVLPEGRFTARWVGADCVPGPRALSILLSTVRARGLRVVVASADEDCVATALKLKRIHRGLQLAGAIALDADLRDRHGLERAAERIRACGAEVLVLTVASPPTAALAALSCAELGVTAVFSGLAAPTPD